MATNADLLAAALDRAIRDAQAELVENKSMPSTGLLSAQARCRALVAENVRLKAEIAALKRELVKAKPRRKRE
jgi:hypothetical protein